MGVGVDWLRLGFQAKQDREKREALNALQQSLYAPGQTTTQPQQGPMLAGQPRPDITAQGEATGLLSGRPEYAKFVNAALATDNSGDMFKGLLSQMSPQQDDRFKNYDQRLKARQSLRKEWNPQLAPSRESIRKYNQATDIIRKKKGFSSMTGADDTVMIKAFASMILPGEAVMEGDINTIINQSGIPGWLKAYAQQVKGKGQLDETARAEIYGSMTGLAERANAENVDIRAQMQPDIEAGGFNPKGLFRSSLEYKPWTQPPPKGFK